MNARQSGLTYVEVLVAMAIIAVALVPAMQALHTGILGTAVYKASSAEHYAAMSLMEELLSAQQGALAMAAGAAGSFSTPSSYSDPITTPARRLVFLSLYDADNTDGDNNVFTVLDPNLDGDNDPYTNFGGLIWVRVEIEGSVTAFESLAAL